MVTGGDVTGPSPGVQDVTQVSCAIKNTQNPRVQFPVGTQSLEMIILSTSQAGLRITSRRRHYKSVQSGRPAFCNTFLHSYREPSPSGSRAPSGAVIFSRVSVNTYASTYARDLRQTLTPGPGPRKPEAKRARPQDRVTEKKKRHTPPQPHAH